MLNIRLLHSISKLSQMPLKSKDSYRMSAERYIFKSLNKNTLIHYLRSTTENRKYLPTSPSNLNVNQTNTKRLPTHPNGSSKEKCNPISPKREHRSFKLSLLKQKQSGESLCTIGDIETALALASLIIGYSLLDGCFVVSSGRFV